MKCNYSYHYLVIDIGDISSAIAASVAAVAIFLTLQQIRINKRINQGQLYLKLEELFESYSDINRKLRPSGDCGAYVKKTPATEEEWTRFEDYVGLFEICHNMIRDKLLNKDDFKAAHGYRIKNILDNSNLVEGKLRSHEDWKRFWTLAKELDYSK